MSDGSADTPVADGARVPQALRRRRTRTAILDAAEAQFVERGYAATTIDRLGPLTNLSKGAVYFHFSSKQDLLIALIDRSWQSVFEPSLTQLSRSDRPVLDRIVGYFNAVGGSEHPSRYLLPVVVSVQGAVLPPQARARVEELHDRVREQLATVIAVGQDQGELTDTADPVDLAALTMALMEGMLLQWHRRAARIDGPQFLRAGRHALVGALAAR